MEVNDVGIDNPLAGEKDSKEKESKPQNSPALPLTPASSRVDDQSTKLSSTPCRGTDKLSVPPIWFSEVVIS